MQQNHRGLFFNHLLNPNIQDVLLRRPPLQPPLSAPIATPRSGFLSALLGSCSNLLTKAFTSRSLLFPGASYTGQCQRQLYTHGLGGVSFLLNTPAHSRPPWQLLSAEMPGGAKGRVWKLELSVVPTLPCQP